MWLNIRVDNFKGDFRIFKPVQCFTPGSQSIFLKDPRTNFKLFYEIVSFDNVLQTPFSLRNYAEPAVSPCTNIRATTLHPLTADAMRLCFCASCSKSQCRLTGSFTTKKPQQCFCVVDKDPVFEGLMLDDTLRKANQGFSSEPKNALFPRCHHRGETTLLGYYRRNSSSPSSHSMQLSSCYKLLMPFCRGGP